MARRGLTYWNRKLHIYLGLYFLLFLWLFAVSGLILNNTHWTFVKSKPVDVRSEEPVTTPAATDDFGMAQDVMRQLDISGEIHAVNRPRPKPPHDLFFSVVRAQYFTFVQVNFDEGVANVRVRKWGFWSGFARLHTVASMSTRGQNMFRDWWMTKVWSVCVDALAIGVLAMLCGGIYMWWQIKPKRRVGIVCLSLGCVSCALFVIGLRALFT